MVIGIAYIIGDSLEVQDGLYKYLFFFGNFSMIENNHWPSPILTPLWSICIEEHFYLVIPVILAFVSIKNIPKVLLGIIIGSILFRLWSLQIESKDWMYFYCHTLSRCDLIAVGGLIGFSHQRKKIKLRLNSLIIPFVIVFLILVLSVLDLNFYHGIFHASIKKYLVFIPIIFLFLMILFNEENGRLINLIKNNQILNYLGKISYGLYMYHMIVITLLSKLDIFEEFPLLRIIITVILTVLISSLSYEFFEKRILRLKERFYSV